MRNGDIVVIIYPYVIHASAQAQRGRSRAQGLCGRLHSHLLFWFTYVQQHKVQGLGEGEYRSVSVVISKYSLSQSHHWSHSSEITEPITVKNDTIAQQMEIRFFRKSHFCSQRQIMWGFF